MITPQIIQLEVGLLQNFNYFVICPETREAALVDPAYEPDTLLRTAKEENLTITSIWITHGHLDHIDAVPEILNATEAKVYIHSLEANSLRDIQKLCLIGNDEILFVGKCQARTIHTPGHTPGGTCYDLGEGVLTGDVLFVRSCGRSDLPGGDTRLLWESLQKLRNELPRDYLIYPGHNYGPYRVSSLEEEIFENPYLRCRSFEEFQALSKI